MIRLDMKTGPFAIPLPGGASLTVRPCSAAMYFAAQAEARAASDDPSARVAALVKALGRAAIIGWDGVILADGTAAEVSPATIDALLDLPPIAIRFNAGYVATALEVVDAGEGSAPALNGDGAGAQTMSQDAGRSA